VSGIEPIELATSSQNVLERPGRGATVAGWGNTIAQVDQVPGGSEIPDRLLEAQVPIVSDSRADKAYAEYVPPLIIAAGGKNNKTTCQGDSGGPLFSALASDSAGENGDGDNGGKYTQIGITSSGPGGCLVKGTPPAVFTELNNPSVRSFITSAASK
jgi:secreted trypsin-like serine protease